MSKIFHRLFLPPLRGSGQSQILDTHTSLLNVDDICSIKIVKQLITSGIIKNGPKSDFSHPRPLSERRCYQAY